MAAEDSAHGPETAGAFHEGVKNLVLVGWSWAFAIVTAWWGASQWRGRARTREMLEAQAAPDEEILLALSYFHTEPLSFVFFVCTVAAASVLQKLALFPVATVGFALVGAPALPWLTEQLISSLWNTADIVCNLSLVGLLPIAYFYCEESEAGAGVQGRLRESFKSFGLLYGLIAAFIFAFGRLISTDMWSASVLLAGLIDLPLYFLCLIAPPLGAGIGFRRVRNAWIPLDLKQQLKERNEAIEIERRHLIQKLAADERKLPRTSSLLQVPTLNEPLDPLNRRARSLSAQRSISRSREAFSKYARHVSLNGLLAPGPNRWTVPKSPISSPEDREGIEQEIENLNFEEAVNLQTMEVPFVAWNIACAVIYLLLLLGWTSLVLHIVRGFADVFDLALPAPSGSAVNLAFAFISALAQSYLIVTAVAGFYAMRLFATLRQKRASFPHIILGLALLCAFALALRGIASDLGVLRLPGFTRQTGWMGKVYALLFLVRLVARGRPRLG